VLEGDSAQFECFSDINTTVTWSFNEGILPDNVKRKATVLAIQPVQIENEGSYECQAYYENGGKYESQAMLKVRSKLSNSKF